MLVVSVCSCPRARLSLARVDCSFELMLAAVWPREPGGLSATAASVAAINTATANAVRLWGARPAISLFPALTGLAVGLALKESRYAGIPAISPGVRTGWFPRSAASGDRLSAFGFVRTSRER